MRLLVVLSIVNWLHMLATVLWIGGMTTNLLVLLPSARRTLEPSVMGALMGAVMGRFRIITYVSIAVLAVTGALMTQVNSQYLGGVFQFGNLWSILTLLKHIVVAMLVILAIYAYEGLARKVRRLAASGPSPQLANLQKKQMGLAVTGFALGIIILLLTAIMTAISSTS